MTNWKPSLVKLRGLEKYTRLLAGVPLTAGMKSGYVTLKPGEAVGEHKTEGREEAIVILEGKASVHCEKKFVFTAEAESLVYIPPGTNHDLRNDGIVHLRYVYVVAPVTASGRNT